MPVDLAKELAPPPGSSSVDVPIERRREPRFYERHGFTAVAATNGDNEEGAPDVRYHWSGG